MHEVTARVRCRLADPGETGSRLVAAAATGAAGYVGDATIEVEIVEGAGMLHSAGDRRRTFTTDEWGLAEFAWTADPAPRTDPRAEEVQEALLRATCTDERVQRLDLNPS